MKDAAATLAAYLVSLSVMFGYAAWLAAALRAERAKRRAREASMPRGTETVATEVKPRASVKVS